MDSPTETKPTRRGGALLAGILLVVIGTVVLLQTWIDLGHFLVLLLGLAFLAWGCLARRTGLLIPGGVLTGIGLGVLADSASRILPGADPNGLFLLCFAAGWFLILLLSALFTCAQWWALIPGGIMAALGGVLILTRGGLRWQDLNLVYAGLLIAAGVALLASRGYKKG